MLTVRLPFVQPLSLASLDSSPSRGASGETVHFAGTAKASPTRSNGDDRRQWRKQGGAVGAAASRMRAAAKQTLGAATRAVSPKVTERASPAGKSRCAAIGRLFVRAILSLCQSCLAAALPSQSGLRPPAPPKGEPLAGRLTFHCPACGVTEKPP